MGDGQTEDLVDRLEDEIRNHVLGEVPADQRHDLATEPLKDLLLIYGNWQTRLISREPREVHHSKELTVRASNSRDAADLPDLIAEIEKGDDLRPHQSKRVRDVDAIDRMLSEWGIQHLHLRSALEASGSGFTERTGDLLFGVFLPGQAYLIGIYKHGDWALRELVEVVVRNWPQSGIFRASEYVLGLTQSFSDEDRASLRNAGINAGSLEVDGKVYSPRTIGQTVTGGSIVVLQRVNLLAWQLVDFRENLTERLASYAESANDAAGRELTGAWTPAVDEGWFGLLREDVFVRIGLMI